MTGVGQQKLRQIIPEQGELSGVADPDRPDCCSLCQGVMAPEGRYDFLRTGPGKRQMYGFDPLVCCVCVWARGRKLQQITIGG